MHPIVDAVFPLQYFTNLFYIFLLMWQSLYSNNRHQWAWLNIAGKVLFAINTSGTYTGCW